MNRPSLISHPFSPRLRFLRTLVGLFLLSVVGSQEVLAGVPNQAPSSFVAQELNGAVALEWSTSAEVGTVGFFLKRWDARASDYALVNRRILPALVSAPQGGTYRYVDADAAVGETLRYLLIEVKASGERVVHGPYSVDTRATDEGTQSADLLNDASLSQRGHSRKAHQELDDVRKKRATGQERDRKHMLTKRRGRNEAAAKIGVRENGVYYVPVDDLVQNGGLSLKSSWRRNFGLTSRGEEVAILPSSDGAGFFFYGTAPESNVEPDHVYRFSSASNDIMRARRHPPRTASPTGSEVFTRTLHVEENRIEANTAYSDPDGDFWVWDYVFAGYQSVSLPFQTEGATLTGPATLTLRLKGGVEAPGSPDHRASVRLNGTLVGDVSFDALNETVATLEFDGRLLTGGANLLEIEGLITGAPYSLFYVDSFDVSYTSRYRAFGNRGEFAAAGNASMFITGFSRSDISVFDITNPKKPVLVNAPVSLHTDGTFGAWVASPNEAAVFYAATPDAIRSADRILPDTPSALKARTNRAEYLVVTTEALMDTAQTLADYRSDLRAQVIDIEDIYDEFNHGNASPYALRDFLRHAQDKWRSAPRYVVLAGDGTYDSKDFRGFGQNLIPTRMADTPSGLYQADSWFVARDDSAEPEIALGRLPVTTTDELSEVIRKVKAREASLGQAWTQKTLLLADNPDYAGNFVTSLEGVAAVLPLGTPVVRAYFSTDGVAGSRAKLINGINSGLGFVAYFGHGGYDQLAGESVFTSWDSPRLTNSLQPVIMTAMTCLVGNSTLPGASGLGETLVRQPGGGLVAMWGPSGWSENYLAEPLANEFYRSAFSPETGRLGDAVQASRQVYRESGRPAYMLSIYNLLGDPALRLR